MSHAANPRSARPLWKCRCFGENVRGSLHRGAREHVWTWELGRRTAEGGRDHLGQRPSLGEVGWAAVWTVLKLALFG